MFSISFQTSAIAVAQIFAMGALGFYLVRYGLIPEPGLRLLSFLSVNVFFPLFIFYQIITNFNGAQMPLWWAFPLINISLVFLGILISSLLVMRHQGSLKDQFLVVSSLHNAGYIPLLMIMSLPLGEWAGQLYTCVILSIIGFDTCLWSLGVWLLTRSQSSRMDLRKMINPPLMSMAAAVIIVLTLGPHVIPSVVLKPIKILGEAAMALAMIVIGGNLGLSSFKTVAWPQVTGVVLVKLMVLPCMTLIILSFLKLNPLISFVAMIQACMPTSITLSIIGRNYETKEQDFVNQCIFVTHLLSMITIPIFLGLYGKLM
jgi:malate permease and related proteins